MNLNFMWSLHLTISGVHWVMLGTVVDFLLGGDAYWANIIVLLFGIGRWFLYAQCGQYRGEEQQNFKRTHS